MKGTWKKLLVAVAFGVAIILGNGCVLDKGISPPDSVLYIQQDTVYLDILGSVDAYNARDLITLERYMLKKNIKNLVIDMCSEGGPVLGMFPIVDQMLSMRAKGIHITVNVYGMAASAAMCVLSAADYVTSTEHTWFMLHPGTWYGGYFPNEDTEAMTKEWEENYARIVSDSSNMTYEQVLEILRTGDSNVGMVWYNAQEALELGLIDEIRK